MTTADIIGFYGMRRGVCYLQFISRPKISRRKVGSHCNFPRFYLSIRYIFT